MLSKILHKYNVLYIELFYQICLLIWVKGYVQIASAAGMSMRALDEVNDIKHFLLFLLFLSAVTMMHFRANLLSKAKTFQRRHAGMRCKTLKANQSGD